MGRFITEIYEPKSRDTVLVSIESPDAIPLATGNWLHTDLLPDATHGMLLITRMEHIIWKTDSGWAHKRMVFTEPAER